MNERIKKLAKKSGATLNEGFDGNKAFVYGITMSPEELEKFAELMIIEFSDVVKQTANEITTAGFKGDGTQDEVMLCVNGALMVLDNIRKRFGVES